MKNERNTLKDPRCWQPKDLVERIGKRIRIRKQDIELFKTSLLQDMK